MYDIEKITTLQKNLDERKYLESINQGKDMSGKMPYCQKCALCSSDKRCNATQDIRQDLRQCARAYLLSNECDSKFYEIDTSNTTKIIETEKNKSQKKKTQKGKKNA